MGVGTKERRYKRVRVLFAFRATAQTVMIITILWVHVGIDLHSILSLQLGMLVHDFSNLLNGFESGASRRIKT